MQKCYTVIGIIIVMIGTVLSLWSILSTKTDDYGTVWYWDNQPDAFKKEKPRVIVGCVMIVIGSIMQIIGTLA